MTYSHFKKPDAYKNISTSTYKEVEPKSYLNKIKNFFNIKNYKFFYQNL
jgi:hypothetical protein